MFQFHLVAMTPAAALDTVDVKARLDEWKEEMDYIIIDCSPTAVSTDAEIWMGAADTVLLVIRERLGGCPCDIYGRCDLAQRPGFHDLSSMRFTGNGSVQAENGYENYVRRRERYR